MRNGTRFLLASFFVLSLSIPGVLGEKGGKKPPSFDPYTLSAGFDCSVEEQSVCTWDCSTPWDCSLPWDSEFTRTGETSYESAEPIDFVLALQGTVTAWNPRYGECDFPDWEFPVGEGRVVFRADRDHAMVRWGIDTEINSEAVNVRFYCTHENFDGLPFEGGTSIECTTLLI